MGGCRRRCRRAGPEEAGDWAGASTLCLVRGVYTTRVHAVFPLAATAIAGKAVSGLNYAEIMLIRCERHSHRLGFFPRRGRPKRADAFPVCRTGNLRTVSCRVNVPRASVIRLAGTRRRRGVMDLAVWALSIVTRAAWAAGCPLEEGYFDGGEGRSGRVRPVRPAEVPEEAAAVPGGAGEAPGGAEVRPAPQPHGHGDRAEPGRCRRYAEDVEWAGSGSHRERRFPDGTGDVQS